jgi:hypothetical protein
MVTTSNSIAELIANGNTLHGAVTELLADQQSFLTETEQQVAATLAAAPSLYRCWHIDQTNGDDANLGTWQSPLASFDEAVIRTPRSGIMDVVLYGEYVIDHIIGINGQQILVKGDLDDPCVIRPLHENLADSTDFAPGFSFRGNYGFGTIRFQTLKIVLAATPSTINPIRRGLVQTANQSLSRFHACEFEVPDTCNTCVVTNSGVDGLHVTNSTVPVNMPGHWVGNVAAGTDPATLPLITTNLTSL